MKSNLTENITGLVTEARKSSLRRPIRLADHGAYEIERIFRGYISVIITAITVPVNILLIFLIVRGKFHSTAHKILVAMAVLQCLGAMSRFVPSIYFYTLGQAEEYIPYDWCVPYTTFALQIPGLFSAWYMYLLALLGIQRCIIVSLPYRASRIFTTKKTLTAIFTLGAISVSIFVPNFFNTRYKKVVVDSYIKSNATVLSCSPQKPVVGIKIVSMLITVFAKLVPFVILVIVNSCLVYKLRKISHWRKKHGGGRKEQVKKTNASTDKMSLITSCIIFVAIIADLPAITAHLYFSYAENLSCRRCSLNTLLAIISSVDTIVYFSSLMIYCCMSKKFRRYLLSVFHLKKKNCAKDGKYLDSTKMTPRSTTATDVKE